MPIGVPQLCRLVVEGEGAEVVDSDERTRWLDSQERTTVGHQPHRFHNSLLIVHGAAAVYLVSV